MRSGKQSNQPVRRRRSWSFLLFLVVVAALVPIALVGWRELYTGFLERSAPEVIVLERPKGIGLLPVALKIRLKDSDAGLDEVVVRARQRNNSQILLRERLGGVKEKDLTIEFPGQDSSLEPGVAQIQIRAFDQSFWSNATQRDITFRVDYRKPTLEVMSTQHNVNQGGAQLVFYRAFDESLAYTGVKVGGNTFLGSPARGIDKAFDDPSLHVALYTVDLTSDPKNTTVRIFAEDEAGNAHSIPFFNRIRPARIRSVERSLSEEYLRTTVASLLQVNKPRIDSIATQIGFDTSFKTKPGSKSRLAEEFQLVNNFMRSVDNTAIVKYLDRPRFERYFDESFDPLPGVVTSLFGDKIAYKFENEVIAQHLQQGFVFRLRHDQNEVFAASDGIVVFSDNLGAYGKVIGIDHGLGLTTIYSSLQSTLVQPGQAVDAGTAIGTVGGTGMFGDNELYFEVRVHGVPVNPREWLDRAWFHAQITSKILELKRQLGIPIYD